ncbi:mitochondrial inner membrane protease subunit 1 [Apostasia shenzhenica]|uniref:Mitochondrial inner membrane protease subunit 1 n=1 Tax=Apostasia shenzhenica TaxID=1088818 RepID=A0A2I0AUK3_9ASPA|nr:mitochondrial inner membrane protease subunit 1 [Apostasia shenzhenica]
MVGLTTWLRYATMKLEHSLYLSWKNYHIGEINGKQFNNSVWKNFFQGRLTFLHWHSGEEMEPTLPQQGGNLLVRKMITPVPTQVFVGDVVLMKDPEKPDDRLVRRLAAVEGYEMTSKDENDEPFILEKDQCWVLADNDSLKLKEARDSRLFGPVHMSDILGRVIYAMKSAVDHGPVHNSPLAVKQDLSILAFELDVDEMSKNSKT